MEAHIAAFARFEARMARRITDAADIADPKRGVVDWKAAAWQLEHAATRERWFQHRETHFHITAPIPPEHIHARSLSDADLLALVPPELAGLISAPERVAEGDTSDPPAPSPGLTSD